MMKRAWLVIIGVLWVASIAASILLTWHIANLTPSSFDESARESVAAGDTEPEFPGRTLEDQKRELAKLEAENAELREQLQQLRSELEKVGSDYLKYAIGQALKDATRERTSREQAYSTWRTRVEVFRRARTGGGMFGGLDEYAGLIADVALLGEPGISCLASIALDTQRTEDEREMALQVLAFIPHKVALQAIMELPDPELFGPDFPYDSIERQLVRLPTSDVEQYIPEINRHVARDLAAREFEVIETRIVAILAFVHDDTFSSSLLRDSRVWQDNLSEVLRAADKVRTDTAMRFLQEVSRTHRNEEYRDTARSILDNW